MTYHFALVIAAAMVLLSSCITNYPKQKPFVYQTNISVEGKYTTEEKKSLESQLNQQLHDSLRTNWQRKFLVANVLNKPPVFDTMNVGKSKIYMTALLNSLGYYRGDIVADTILKIKHKRESKGDQYRTTLNIKVNPGTLIRLDSIAYNLPDSAPHLPQIDTLQAITLNSLNKKLIKKGDPFSKPLISSELDRLSDEYRNNGYLRFTKEQLLGVWDTVGIALLRPTFDPIEQARLLEALTLRRQNPIADLEIRLKPNPDPLKLTRYYIGNVKVFPDNNVDTSLYQPLREILAPDKYEFISYQRLFKSRKLVDYIYLHRGELYRQSNYLKTQNKFNSIGSWRLVNITQQPRAGEDSVDFEIRLVPAAKYYTSVNFDVSKNQGNLISEGNLLGLGANFTILNRNFARSANQSTTTFRYGIELAQRIDSVQTQQFSLNHTIQFPRVMLPKTILRLVAPAWREDGRTFLGTNLGYVDRRDYYRVQTANASWGYEFNANKKLHTIRWPNIEFNLVEKRSQLDTLIKHNASYKYIFNDGMIVSVLYNYTTAKTRKNVTTIYKAAFELAGFPGFIKTIFPDTRIYRFAKTEAQIVSVYKFRKNAIALRAFLGLGKAMPFSLDNNKKDSSNYWLPFFRQYFAGGPNSMRAWSVRKLGPGSTIKSYAKDIAPDRFGDMRIETNAEYRYYITTVVGFPLEGALFIDVGNVWFLRKNDDFPSGEFELNRLFHDLAVGVGTGFRIDFGLLKLRFDLGWKAKDPSPEDPAAQNKWFYNQRVWIGDKNGKNGGQFQIGIDYPF